MQQQQQQQSASDGLLFSEAPENREMCFNAAGNESDKLGGSINLHIICATSGALETAAELTGIHLPPISALFYLHEPIESCAVDLGAADCYYVLAV